MTEHKELSLGKKYLIPQLAAFTGLPFWYPFMARCVYTETNFIQPNFASKYTSYFKSPMNSFRGISPFAIGQLFYPVLDISATEISTSLAQNNNPTIKHKLGGAVLAGVLSAGIYNPLKAIVVITQNNKLNTMDSAKHIYKTAGIAGFYRGSTFYMVRNGTYAPCLLMLSSYIDENLKTINPVFENEYISKPLSVLFPAFIATAISMPADVFSSVRLSDLTKNLYKTNYEVIMASYKARSFFGFFAGFRFRLMATATEFLFFNTSKEIYTHLLAK
jgi:hypothetical protein